MKKKDIEAELHQNLFLETYFVLKLLIKNPYLTKCESFRVPLKVDDFYGFIF
jgi:hypothetical protein